MECARAPNSRIEGLPRRDIAASQHAPTLSRNFRKPGSRLEWFRGGPVRGRPHCEVLEPREPYRLSCSVHSRQSARAEHFQSICLGPPCNTIQTRPWTRELYHNLPLYCTSEDLHARVARVCIQEGRHKHAPGRQTCTGCSRISMEICSRAAPHVKPHSTAGTLPKSCCLAIAAACPPCC